MSEATEAVELFSGSYACSQAILSAFAPSLGLDTDQAIRLSAGFAAGMRQGDFCGAVTGATMVLGLALCKEDCVTSGGREEVGSAVCEFADRFRQLNGSLDCPDIIGCDLRTADGMNMAKERGLFATKCSRAVRDAAEILEDMLGRR